MSDRVKTRNKKCKGINLTLLFVLLFHCHYFDTYCLNSISHSLVFRGEKIDSYGMSIKMKLCKYSYLKLMLV